MTNLKTFDIDKIIIPKWISSSFYNTDKLQKAYICNELNHEFIELEGLPSILWNMLILGAKKASLEDFCKENDCLSELNDFLSKLLSVGLIVNSKIYNPQEDGDFSNINPQNMKNNNEDISAIEEFEREKNIWLVKNNFLPRLFIELTHNCNEKCIHCLNDKQDLKTELSFEAFKSVTDEAFMLGVPRIILSGGECTLNKDFIKIAEYIREKRISLEIFTNGQTLYDNENLLNRVENLYPHRVSLSLYSLNEAIHDEITGIKGSHAKTLSVIKRLKEKNISVEIKCFAMNKNASTCTEIAKFAQELGGGVTASLDCKFFNNPTRNNNNVRIQNKQMFKLYTDKNSLLYVKDEITSDLNSEKFKNRRICGGEFSGLSISPNGDITVCPSWKIPVGNIKTDSIKKLWNNKTQTKLKSVQSIKIKDLKECFKYEYCKHCVYCPGMAMSNNKDLKPFKDFCNDAKVRFAAYKYNQLKNKKSLYANI